MADLPRKGLLQGLTRYLAGTEESPEKNRRRSQLQCLLHV